MLSRLRPGLLLLATALAVALGVPSSAHAAPAPKPRVGQCHQLTLRQMSAPADIKKAVSCGHRHNTLTVAVVTSPTSLSGLSADETLAIGNRLCTNANRLALGRNAARRATSAYVGFFFAPTADQVAQGARWFRCDIGLEHGRAFASLPKSLHRPILPRRVSDSTRRCLTKAGVTTTCTQKHAFRPIGTVTLSGPTYPTHDEFMAAAVRSCPKSSAWTTWGSEDQWNAGDRVLVCYKKTRK